MLCAFARTPKEATVIRHVVFFKFKPEVSAEERKDFVLRLKDLPERVPGIMKDGRGTPEVGEDFMGAPLSYHVALIFTFPDRQALERYASHPNHLPVVERGRQICESIAAVDFEV